MSLPCSNGAPAHNRTFKKRWALAVFSRPEKPAGAVAMAFKIYTEMDANGEGAVISDEDFRVSCGVSDGSCRVFKRWLVANDLIKIVTRGQRGRSSKFMATIPATGAGVQVEAAADAATIHGEEYRQSSPVIENEIPAIGAAAPEMPAHAAASAPSRALVPAHFETPSGLNNTNNYQPTTTVELVAARGGGHDHDPDFPGLNGTAVDLIAFIGRHSNVTDREARRMLATNIRAYGADAMLDAYSVTVAEMAARIVASPYKFLMGCARNAKAKAASFEARGGESRTARTFRLAAENTRKDPGAP